MEKIIFLVSFFFVMVAIDFLFGLFLTRFRRTHKYGILFWAMSGLSFLTFLIIASYAVIDPAVAGLVRSIVTQLSDRSPAPWAFPVLRLSPLAPPLL